MANKEGRIHNGVRILRNYWLSGKPALRGIDFGAEESSNPRGGLGTRLLSVTKEQPKEMLPIFAKAKNGSLCLNPR
jgi:hypothetical protein